MKDIEFTQQGVCHVDATPNANYPLRILETYRANCNTLLRPTAKHNSGLEALCGETNKAQRQRANLLDAAIRLLKTHNQIFTKIEEGQEKE